MSNSMDKSIENEQYDGPTNHEAEDRVKWRQNSRTDYMKVVTSTFTTETRNVDIAKSVARNTVEPIRNLLCLYTLNW